MRKSCPGRVSCPGRATWGRRCSVCWSFWPVVPLAGGVRAPESSDRRWSWTLRENIYTENEAKSDCACALDSLNIVGVGAYTSLFHFSHFPFWIATTSLSLYAPKSPIEISKTGIWARNSLLEKHFCIGISNRKIARTHISVNKVLLCENRKLYWLQRAKG